MRKLWLLFAQSAALTLGAILALSVLTSLGVVHLDWLPTGKRGEARNDVVTINQAPTQAVATPLPGEARNDVVTINQAPTQAVATPLPAPVPAGAPVSFSNAAKKAMPSVVNIFTSKQVRAPSMDDPAFRRFFGERFGPQRQSSLGSGVIVSDKGYVLTNHHVIEAADEIRVALADGRAVDAKLVGADPDTDLAVLRVKLDHIPAVTFGNADSIKIGDVVLAIGNPFGVGQTVTMGIVSAVGRSHLGISTYENFIQTDAAINPGNSGGALVDVNGNLIGINSAIYSRSGGNQGIGFTIPVSLAKDIMEQIIQTGGVTRGWIGVEVQDVNAELAETLSLKVDRGALISGVLNGGPADRGGIKPGDVVVDINGKPVLDSAALMNLISGVRPGNSAKIKVKRGNANEVLDVQVAKRPRAQREEQ
jgi:serine protease DegQ